MDIRSASRRPSHAGPAENSPAPCRPPFRGADRDWTAGSDACRSAHPRQYRPTRSAPQSPGWAESRQDAAHPLTGGWGWIVDVSRSCPTVSRTRLRHKAKPVHILPRALQVPRRNHPVRRQVLHLSLTRGVSSSTWCSTGYAGPDQRLRSPSYRPDVQTPDDATGASRDRSANRLPARATPASPMPPPLDMSAAPRPPTAPPGLAAPDRPLRTGTWNRPGSAEHAEKIITRYIAAILDDDGALAARTCGAGASRRMIAADLATQSARTHLGTLRAPTGRSRSERRRELEARALCAAAPRPHRRRAKGKRRQRDLAAPARRGFSTHVARRSKKTHRTDFQRIDFRG